MSIRIFRLFTLFMMLGFAMVQAEVWTQSTISTNTTWQKNNSTGDGVYIVDLDRDTLTISDYATLTIEPGVTVKFHDDIKVLVYGVLDASGTAADSVLFMVDDGAGTVGEWGGIKFLSIDSTDANQLRYCRIEGGDADATGPGTPDASKSGGGIYFGPNIGRATVLANSVIQNNHAYESGGGIAIAGSPTIQNTIVRWNSADQYGGGIGMKGPNLSDLATPLIDNSLLLENSSTGQGGGGIGMLSGAYLTLNNSLVYNNTATNGPGGGLYLYNQTTQASVANTVIRQNSATSSAQIYGTAAVTYSNVEGGYVGSGNISSDPAYTDPSQYDFSFDALSPIVDAGNNAKASATDFYGNTRPFDGDRDGTPTTDMGPYEYQNSAPQITSTPQTAATEDQLYTYQAEVTDPDAGESFTWSLVSGPSFLTMNASSGELSGTPLTDSDAGDHSVNIQVADANGVTDTQTFTLTVQAVNDAPVVSGIPDQTIAEGDAFATITLDDYVTDEEDADADITWTYSGNLQLNVQITNRVATITPPDADWYGSETITFTAHDLSGATDGDAATFTITNVNDAPVVSDIPDQTIDEGASFVQVQLDNYVNDIDNIESDLNWAYSGNSELSVSIDANRVATISIPNSDWFGAETITFTATDPGGLSDSDAALFTVNAVNDAPVVSTIPDQTIDEGQSFTSINLDDYVSDVDNLDSEISWQASGNTDLNVAISADRVATISIPNADWFGAETITFTATDPGQLRSSTDVVFTVNNINDAPVAVDDAAATDEDVSVAIAVTANDSDIENDNLTVQAVGTAAHGTVEITSPTEVTYTPAADWSGLDSFTYTVSDGNGGSDQASVSVTVNAVNDAPVVSTIPNQTIDEGQNFTTINLDDYVNDVDNLDSEISWQASGNTDLSVEISADRIATISIPNADWFGAETITFTATDPGQLSGSTDVVFTVNNINDAPVAVDDAAATDEDVSVAISVTANDSDIENDNLTVQAVGTAAHGTVEITSPTEVTFTPAADWSGSDSFTYTVSDGNGGTDQASVSVTVNAVNDAPVVSAIPDQTIDEGQNFTTINLDDYVSDVDNTDLEMSWQSSGNTDLGVEISADRIATISIPNTDWFGAETITFTATDPGQLSSSTDVVFTVTNINDAPQVSKPADQTIDEGAAFSVINLDDYVQDVDNSDAEMNWQADGNTELLVDVNENRQATVSTPNADWFGSETVHFIASDPGGLSDTTSVQFTVQAINDAPQILTIADQTTNEGELFSPFDLDTLVTDVDDDVQTLTWQASGYQQLQVSIDSLHVVTVTIPDSNWFGSEAVTFTVSDTSAASDSSVVLFTVQPANDAPLVSQIPGDTVSEGQTFSSIALNDFVYDVDNSDNEITWTVNGSQDLLVSLNEQNVATITPPDSNWFGSETLTFVASDPGGLSDSSTATFEILAVNDAPQLANIETQTIAEGQNFAPLNLDDFVQDVDDADSTLVWSVSGFDSLQFTLENRVLSVFTPSEDWNGSETAQLTVRDTSGLQDSIGVLFEVLAVNDSTRLTGTLPQLTFAEDDTLWFDRSGWYSFVEDKDNPDSTLQFTALSGKYVQVRAQGSGFTYRAPADWFGVDSLWLTVGDGLTADSGLYVVDVRPVNDAPQIVNLPQSAAFERDTTLVLEMNSYRQDVDTPDSLLSWSFAVSNDSLLYEWVAENGQLTLSALRFAGDVDLICTLTDDSMAVARDTIVVTVSAPTAIGDETVSGLPQTFALQQNYPNPFNPSTTIGYQLPKATEVQLEVFNILGQKVATLVNGNQPAGYYKVRWQAGSVANGVYFYKLQAGDFIKIRKMMLIK